MIVYFCVLAALGMIFAVRSSNLSPLKQTKDMLYWLAWLILLLVVILRYNVGTDYRLYRYNYTYRYETDISIFLSNSSAVGNNIVALISKLLYDDYATWFAIMGCLAIIPCAIWVKRESIAPALSTVLFVVLCCWHTTFNIVAQCASIGILALGYSFLLERKFFKWCIICLLASMFHVTAVVMIPVYFLVSPRVSWKRTAFLIGVGVAITLLYEELFELMNTLSKDDVTESMTSSYGSDQLNIFRVLVNCAPAAAATVLLRYYDLQDRKFCLLYNMSMFNAVLNLGTMNSAYLNRFALYTIIYNVFFLPYLLKPFARKTRAVLWCCVLALYIVYWAYDLYKCPDTVNYYWIFQRAVR